MLFSKYLMLCLALIPLVLGVLVATLKAPSLHAWLGRLPGWLVQRHAAVATKRGWWMKLAVQPYLGIGHMLDRLTAPVAHTGLRQGLHLTLLIYAWVGWTLALVMGLSLLLSLVVGLVTIVIRLLLAGLVFVFIVAVLIAILKAFVWNGSETQRSYERGRRLWTRGDDDTSTPPVTGTFRPGTRVNRKTGMIQEETALGFFDTEERVNPETGVIQEQTALGFFNTDTRINPRTGEVEERSALGWFGTGKRVHPETGVIQEQNALGWFDTDERIDPKTGRHQKRDAFGWWDD